MFTYDLNHYECEPRKVADRCESPDRFNTWEKLRAYDYPSFIEELELSLVIRREQILWIDFPYVVTSEEL